MTLTKTHKNIIGWFIVLAIAAGIYVYTNPNTNFSKDDAGGIQFFRGTWTEALAFSQKEQKPIFLDVYATWCGPCKRLKEYVFSNKNVGTYFNKHFINVSFNAEVDNGITVSNQYQVNSYPSLLFINNDGTIKTKHEGYIDADALIALGKLQLGQ
jgi:thioredoxin 1